MPWDMKGPKDHHSTCAWSSQSPSYEDGIETKISDLNRLIEGIFARCRLTASKNSETKQNNVPSVFIPENKWSINIRVTISTLACFISAILARLEPVALKLSQYCLLEDDSEGDMLTWRPTSATDSVVQFDRFLLVLGIVTQSIDLLIHLSQGVDEVGRWHFL
jgi:hypothetical protein